MDFRDSPEEAAFRAEARAWIKANGPHYVTDAEPGTKAYIEMACAWQRAKADAGYAGFNLPKELGGRGGPPIEAAIFAEEESGHPMFDSVKYFVLGQNQVANAIQFHGTPEQAERFTRPSIRGDIVWCQLWSEPAAGSDMGGIRTRATRDGDDWIVNGQKIWTSYAPPANWGLLLARTDSSVPKHKGLSVFVVDLETPGVEFRPLKQITERYEFNEVFFTDARIPHANMVGKPGEGWKVAVTTMQTERFALLGDPATMLDKFDHLAEIALRVDGRTGRRPIDDKIFRGALVDYYVTRTAMKYFHYRILTSVSRGGLPGVEAAIGKMALSKWSQSMAALGMDALGPASMVADGADEDLAALHYAYLRSPASRIGGGTEEITKNVIAERVLGLPPDLRVDKDLPFNAVIDAAR